MCRMCAISICLREKYLARINMTRSLTGSDGWNEKEPSRNQLCALQEPPIYRAEEKKNTHRNSNPNELSRKKIIARVNKRIHRKEARAEERNRRKKQHPVNGAFLEKICNRSHEASIPRARKR